MTSANSQQSNQLLRVSGIITSMAFMAFGNGLMFAYVPLRLAKLGYAPDVAGWVLTAMAIGGLIGCFAAAPLVRQVGHARTFMTLAASTILSHGLLTFTEHAGIWALARMIYGGGVTGLFIVSQSWLNDAVPCKMRGHITSVFYMVYVLSIGIGGYLIAWLPLGGTQAPVLAIIFVAAAIISTGVTQLSAPPPPTHARVSLPSVWTISPVGLTGAFVVGGLTMLVQGFSPIFMQAEGYDAAAIGVFLLLIQLGMIVVQLPLGIASDRVDRRIVLCVAAVMVAIMSLTALAVPDANLYVLIVIFAIWAGATETVFSVSNAHANDRSPPEYLVAVSSTMMFAWSISGVLIPAFSSFLSSYLGHRAFMGVAAGLAVSFTAFVIVQMLRRSPPASTETGRHRLHAGQTALLETHNLKGLDADDG